MKYLLLLIVLGFSSLPVLAQVPSGTVSKTAYTFPLKGTVVPTEIEEAYHPRVSNFGATAPQERGHFARNSGLQTNAPDQQPVSKTRQPSARKTPTANAPTVLRNFDGNVVNGANNPNDNTLAISNGDMLLSCTNNDLNSFDINNGTILFQSTLDGFAQSLGLTGFKFDPHVLYDPVADRFIIAYLNGAFSTESQIIVGFSTSNDPSQAWNLYTLSGNPLNNSMWTDFPLISITEGELFITADLFSDGNIWSENIVWQVDKSKGYAGDALTTELWSNIEITPGTPVPNLFPLRGGSAPSGPNMYFLGADRTPFAAVDDFYLVEISGAIGSSPTINVQTISANLGYLHSFTGAHQMNFETLRINNCRVLGGFVEDGQAQFVLNSVDQNTTKPAVYHGVISDLNNPSVVGTIVSSDSLEFGYPNIAYVGTTGGAPNAIIAMGHTSASTFAGSSCVFVDAAGEYSPITTIKEGEGIVDLQDFNPTERWGDYVGIQTKYNEPGVAWIGSHWADNGKKNRTWITEVRNPDTPPATTPDIGVANNAINLYPNPAIDFTQVEFDLASPEIVRIELYDLNGRLIAMLVHDKMKEGHHVFSFSMANLPSGTYLLKFTGEQGYSSAKRVVKG